MRLLPLPLAILLALPLALPAAHAQSPYTPERGGYVGLDELSVGSASLGIGLTAGYRFGNGLDTEVLARYASASPFREVTVAPRMGYTRALSPALGVRAGVSALASFSDAAPDVLTEHHSSAFGVGADVSAFTRVPLGRGVELLPTVGAFGHVTTTHVSQSVRPPSTNGGNETALGVSFALPVSIRVGARGRFVLEPMLNLPLYWQNDAVGNADRLYPPLGLRLRYNF